MAVDTQDLWEFETEVLAGTIRPWGHHHGVNHLIHKPTGVRLVHPDYTLFNLYFIFCEGACLASARSAQKTVRVHEDCVSIHWKAAELHRAELTACYRVLEPNIIEFSVTVNAMENYTAYEAFLSSYFDLSLRPYVYVSGGSFVGSRPHWYTPVVESLYRDNAIVFPRDARCARMHLDGRWGNVKTLYQWKSQQYYGLPLAVQADRERGVGAVLMSQRQDCPSINWTVGISDPRQSSYRSDHLDDPMNARNPLYFSLFGEDVEAGVERTARVRLVVVGLDDDFGSVVELCRESGF